MSVWWRIHADDLDDVVDELRRLGWTVTPPPAEPRDQETPWEHPGHRPVQHRDGKPPWCDRCGWSSPVAARPPVQYRVQPPDQGVDQIGDVNFVDPPASITCPRCGRTSWNPNDVREGYCGACHDWTGTDEGPMPRSDDGPSQTS